ncbi:hypothetical protein BKA66DRAFT_444425 [Pyrenochaeta sp. MPI-SDFR-AT-0127]|nr:hypothetical protein BKA66DRAFT_444425 [Pyrenochaeta sp. MPI-SDFR-AT-0127]
MPRPCQKRRASAAAQRKPKPAGPPPIRHKARQKAIHNARRGRGRGNLSGGRPSRNQQSGHEMEQDFISFASNGNNFHRSNGIGSQYDPIALDDTGDSELEEGELITDDGSDSDDTDDLDMYDAEDMMINVQMDQPLTGKGKIRRAEVMFTVQDAVVIYKALWQAGFPLLSTGMEKYGLQEENTPTESASYISFASSSTSVVPNAESTTKATRPAGANTAGDYVFNWGKHSGVHFLDVPESYLRTIGGQLDIYEVKHPGLREAFEFHRPGQGRTGAPQQPPMQTKPQPPQTRQLVPKQRQTTRSNTRPPSETYIFKTGAHKGRKLNEVPENYLRTIEGMKNVVNNWPGLKEALQDFNEKTGRRGRV